MFSRKKFFKNSISLLLDKEERSVALIISFDLVRFRAVIIGMNFVFVDFIVALSPANHSQTE